ncbi:MAG: GNAT family N-acetyltransferase [Pseudonocardia sp.]|uniref:GNAT family N-acetyltransferase n=1 Tax=Pseudonocardia sp. TaxID=60912 RepID=UPI001AC64AEC|nr:GNAT family N-acetyltransferase [Pseudonocardia sp.]MBN9098875.1 GNAT family N-acetyltransferase [Pseudonocardia sp.]
MTIFLTTERLTLRRITADDEQRLHALHSDPTVMRYLARPSTREDIRDDPLPYYLGPLRTVSRVLHTAAWGRGFATEGARALVDKGFGEVFYELTRSEWSRARPAAAPGRGGATRPR